MAQEHRSQRTERPTARRLKKAREKGQVPRSREVSGAAVLTAFLLFAYLVGPSWLQRLKGLTASLLAQCGRFELGEANVLAVLHSSAISTGLLLAAPLGMVAVAGVAGNLIQGPPAFTFKPLEPKFDKFNPLKGLKKIVSLKKGVEVLKSLLKMALYGSVAWFAASGVIVGQPLGRMGAEGTFHMLASLTGTVLLHGTALAAALAALDFLFKRYDHTRDLKMTKREIKEEHKETEGDPMIRARIRQKQSALARSRMMAEVPNATVVVTNPEHVAVALRYVPGETSTPKVLAKGRALLAARIRAIAKQHRIPIVSDPPLARALYRSVAVGAEIPHALFRAVAEVLALVLSRKGARARSPLADHGARR